ncbi:hypothetical protein HYT02_03195 [Candidatus Gottesmanbacteria bacterium]|nr:hypothetical protein [Candidatus Gottesmanbacteria bacterium]
MENGKGASAADIMAMRINGGAMFSIHKDALNGTSPQEHIQAMYGKMVLIGKVETLKQDPYVVVYARVAERPEPQPNKPSTNGKQLHF